MIFRGVEWINTLGLERTSQPWSEVPSFGLGFDHAWRHKLRFSFHKFPNPFVKHTVLAIIGMASVALILPSYFAGKKIHRGSSSKKLREITTTKNTFTLSFLGGCRWGDAESAAISHH